MGSADARYRERADNKMRQSVAASDKADYYERRAQAAENNTAISSDDPEAIAKLTEKLEGLKQTQEFMKAVNAYYKKNGTCQGLWNPVFCPMNRRSTASLIWKKSWAGLLRPSMTG